MSLDQSKSYNKEYLQIVISAAVTGPLTWPLAAELIAKQQGNHSYRFLTSMRMNGALKAFSGCAPYSSYKLFGIGSQRGVQTPVLEYINRNFNVTTLSDRLLQYTVAGVASGVFGGFIVTPVEQLKISFANKDFSSYKETRKFFFADFQRVASLFAGVRATVARNVVFDSVNSILYNVMLANDVININRKNAFHMGVINCIAGVTTAVIDYPLDVIKTRIQSSTVSRQMENKIITSVWQAGKTMIRNEGWRSLYYGLKHKISLYAMVWLVYGVSFGVLGSVL